LKLVNEDNEKWIRGELLGIKKEEVSLKDVVFGHSLRKQSLMFFLPLYVKDVSLYNTISFELEDLYNKISEISHAAFLRVNQELLVREKTLSEKVLDSSLHGIVAFKTIRNQEKQIIDFQYVFANKVAKKMLNREKSSLVGKRLLEEFPGIDPNGNLIQLYKKVVEEGISYDEEFYVGSAGFNKWLRQSGVKWEDGLVVSSVDITVQKEQEALIKNLNTELEYRVKERTHELEISERKLKEAQRISNMGNWEFNVINGKIQWSEEIFRIHEVEPEQGEPDFETLKKLYTTPHLFQSIVQKAIENGISYQEDMEIVTLKGNQKTIQIIGKPEIDETGKCVRLYGTVMDITDRKKAEEIIKRNEHLLKTIINRAPAIITYFDPNFKYQFVNNHYLKWFNFSSDKVLLGKTLEDIIGKDHFAQIKPHLDSVLNGNPVEYVINTKDYKKDDHHLQIKYIPDIFEDQIRGIIVIGIDLTDRIISERKLNEQNQQLIRINADLDNFIYTASHDLKAPVSNLEGLFLALLSEVEVKESLLPLKEMINISFTRFKNTIKDLTEISKVHREEDKNLEVIQLEDLCQEVAMDIKTDILTTEAHIYFDFKIPEIQFSRKNARSIVYNLLSNAIKYRSLERSPEISVRSFEDREFVVVEVKDNGLGILEQNLTKIFGMFKRGHDHVEGSGIGLYIVKKIIENAGGKIEVTSKVDQGSTFTVYFKSEK
jgi:PAS domain S-box-containing protein